MIKELLTPSPRVRRDMTEAISRHQADLVYNFLSKYKVPELVRVIKRRDNEPPFLIIVGAIPGRGGCAQMSTSTGITPGSSVLPEPIN